MCPLITISIVSHGQASLIRSLFQDLSMLSQQNFEVILTINIPEDESPYQGHSFPLQIIRNASPKGFGSNHNVAFARSSGQWFAVVNPDIRVSACDLRVLLSPFADELVAAVAPTVLSVDGSVEDSARRFPTLFSLVKRFFLCQRALDYEVQAVPYPVDWVAGMFIVFRRDAFKIVGGFDDRRFFMYLEDADVCRRLSKKGWKVFVNPRIQVVHLARRASRRDLKHLRWHTVSALRFLTGL